MGKLLRVLLVDDEPFIVQGLSVLLDWAKEGFEIAGMVSNGAEAVQFLKEQKVDLVIADIKMPVMSGLELLRLVREEKLSEAYFVILSGYGDFEYAREALRYECIDYLLKPVQKEELTGILEKIAAQHSISVKSQHESSQSEKAHLTRNVIALLSGKYDQINLDYVKQHLQFTELIRYVSIELDVMEMSEAYSEEQKRQFQRQLYQNCMSDLGEEKGRYCFFDVSGQERRYDIGLLYCDKLAAESEVAETTYFNNFMKKNTHSLGVPVVMFVGCQVLDVAKLSESYRSVQVMKSMQSFRKKRMITYYGVGEENTNKSHLLCKKTIDALLRAVEQNNRDQMEQQLNLLYEEINGLGQHMELIELNINYLLFQLIHLAAEQDDDVNQEEIMCFISENEFGYGVIPGSKEHLKKFVFAYAEYITQLRKRIYSGVLGQIEKEVEQYFKENLTLKELSKKYYINSAYLGQIFQKKHGQSFKDYLNNYRMEQAVVLLVQTDKKIYEIAEAVGYHDAEYFINRFIAFKGSTPTKFRKHCREGGAV